MRNVSTASVAILENAVLDRHTYLNCYFSENEPDNPVSPKGVVFIAGGYNCAIYFRIHVDATVTFERTRARPVHPRRRYQADVIEYLVRTPDGRHKWVLTSAIAAKGNVLVRFDLGLKSQIRYTAKPGRPVSEDPWRGLKRAGPAAVAPILNPALPRRKAPYTIRLDHPWTVTWRAWIRKERPASRITAILQRYGQRLFRGGPLPGSPPLRPGHRWAPGDLTWNLEYSAGTGRKAVCAIWKARAVPMQQSTAPAAGVDL